MASILISYIFMALAQTRGPIIIELLHGKETRQTAEAVDVVRPDSDNLCSEYEAAHFDRFSDMLHTVGMIGAIVVLLLSLNRPGLLLKVPPIYYLPAWIGHFMFQKDIPAVFSYGTTLRGWLSGEYCAFLALAAGRTVQKQVDWVAVAALTGLLVSVATGRREQSKVKAA